MHPPNTSNEKSGSTDHSQGKPNNPRPLSRTASDSLAACVPAFSGGHLTSVWCSPDLSGLQLFLIQLASAPFRTSEAQMTTFEIFNDHVMQTYSRFPLTLVEGRGARVRDDAGREYLDFCMGIAVCSLGHCHPRIVGAIREQAGMLMHVSNLYFNKPQGDLAREMNEQHIKLPGKIFFSNSGAEANDGLIKSARRFGHLKPQPDGKPRFEVITFQQSFHGRTLGSMAATGQQKIQQGFDPLLPGFRYLPYNDLGALENAVTAETAAFLLEPIQGVGGIHVATKE
ncbi:MAG: aminotransferase class III-fold pyridoxal phosphate-dependent enzyme, partial [Armatimonadetes bacterium]|nr:aminotransferase class III-fold pyridoxal phosphate-dependent enzyme [Akkermansiaceae bacterium]